MPDAICDRCVPAGAAGELLRAVPVDGCRAKRNGEERARDTSRRSSGPLILVSLIYVGFKVILPVLINEYQFQDELQDIARFASVNRKNN